MPLPENSTNRDLSRNAQARVMMIGQTLRKTPLFANLPPNNLDRLAAGCVLQGFAKGEILFHAGMRAEGFYVVHTGAVNLHRVTADGREQVIRVFYPGESFAEIVIVGDGSFPASAKATKESKVILIPGAFFRQEIQNDPDLALRILASMSMHLRFLVETIEDLKLKQAETRVSQWLLRQLNESGKNNDNKPTFTLPLAKHLLASQLGISSETLSRVLAGFRDRNWLSIEGKEITFLDIDVLRQMPAE
jgi:CRP-like cAMP-binding protein